jgi:hypothetical protein
VTGGSSGSTISIEHPDRIDLRAVDWTSKVTGNPTVSGITIDDEVTHASGQTRTRLGPYDRQLDVDRCA